MKKRTNNDIWQGLFEFFLIETDTKQNFNELTLPDQLINTNDQWNLNMESKLFKHILTHQNIMCRFYHIQFDDTYVYNEADWASCNLYSIEETEDLPKPILIDKYLGEKII